MGNNKGNDIKRVNKEKGVANMLNYSTPGNAKPKAKKKTQSAYAGAGYVDEPKKNQQKEKLLEKANKKNSVAVSENTRGAESAASKEAKEEVKESKREGEQAKQEENTPVKNIEAETDNEPKEVQEQEIEEEVHAPSEMLIKSNQEVHEAKEEMQETLNKLEKVQNGFTGNLSRPRGIGSEISKEEAEKITYAAEENPEKKVIKGHHATVIIEYDKTPKKPKKKEIKELILQSVEYNFTYSSTKKICKIGKARSEDIHLTSRFISRHHATIEEKDGEYYLTDDKSTNGTLLNGTKLDSNVPMKISVGDSIQFADMKFIFGVGTAEI